MINGDSEMYCLNDFICDFIEIFIKTTLRWEGCGYYKFSFT